MMYTLLPLLSFIPAILVPVTLIVHILLALGVNNEAAKLRAAGLRPYALSEFVWVFLVLVTGLLGFLSFWLIHHSSLRAPSPDKKAAPGWEPPL